LTQLFPFAVVLSMAAMIIGVVWALDARQVLEFSDPPRIDLSDRLRVRGTNHAEVNQIVVVRIDDRESPVYADRINIERVVPPGPFDLSIPLHGLQTPAGRSLQADRLRRIICFPGNGAAGLSIEPPLLVKSVGLPEGSMGWDIGPEGSPLWPGFLPLDASSPEIAGNNLTARDRGRYQQAVEGLTTDGMRGIDRLHLALPPGRWFVTLWLHDRGEWEYLPHPLGRFIRANGKQVAAQQYSPRRWISEVYLAGRTREPHRGSDVWSLFGEQPAGRISFPVDVDDAGLEVAFAGDMPEAGYLAAILAEPSPAYAVREKVESDRAQWWRNNWRIVQQDGERGSGSRLIARQKTITAARDTSATLVFELHTDMLEVSPEISMEAPAYAGRTLPGQLRWAQWHLRRSTLSSTLLEPVARHLRGDSPLPAAPAGHPRILVIQLDIPADAVAGNYRGELHVDIDGLRLMQPLLLTVPDVNLPALDRPVGVYLERPVHFTWFPEMSEQSERALRCDLEFLRKLGLTGVSPGLTTPNSPHEVAALTKQVRQAVEAGFMPPFIAYAPFKRLRAERGLESAAAAIGGVEHRLAEHRLPGLAWSIADEPSNHGQVATLARSARYVDNYAPSAMVAAHLNDPRDVRYLDILDIALLNDGFGVDAEDINAVRRRGAIPWLYNLRQRRAATGFYLWRVDAAGYLQWHARMPTADPFDPTDGREDDVQFLYPMDVACPTLPDVGMGLYDIVEGITDLRWLLWLEQAAQNDPSIAAKLEQLRRMVPDTWDRMSEVSGARMDAWRAIIIDIASVRAPGTE
jgi:hypothetical protein